MLMMPLLITQDQYFCVVFYIITLPEELCKLNIYIFVHYHFHTIPNSTMPTNDVFLSLFLFHIVLGKGSIFLFIYKQGRRDGGQACARARGPGP